MMRELLLAGACAGLGFITAIAAPSASAPRPNIVFILADDLGYSDLGCYGSEIPTPNLDQLAAEGVRFSQFHTTPRCCPTRAALLTGVYPQQAGIGNMMEDRGLPGYRGEISRNCLTIAEELRRAGYRTSMVGKWHVSHIYFEGKKQLNFETTTPFWDTKDTWPLQRGFEHYFGTIHGVCSYYDPFSLVDGNTPVAPDRKDFYYTDVLSDHAVAEISRQAGGTEPFFLYVAYTAPHWPLQAPEADIAKYRARYMEGWDAIRAKRHQRQIASGLLDAKWELTPRDPNVRPWSEVKDKEWEANRMATYAAMVEHLDTGVGRIMAALRKKGVADNTLVIFMSDNGACSEGLQPRGSYDVPTRTRDGRDIKVGNVNHSVFAGPVDVWQSYGAPWANVSNTPFVLYKHFTHEGGIATPFIARWPAAIHQAGAITSQFGHVTDVMATLVDVAGATHPSSVDGRAIQPLEGQSLRPVLEGRPMQHHPVFWEHEGNRAVRSGKWKLVARNHRAWELYDVEADRTELHDLAATQPELVRELGAQYDAWATRCQVVPPQMLPPQRPIVPASTE